MKRSLSSKFLLALFSLCQLSLSHASNSVQLTTSPIYAPYKDFTINAYWDNQTNSMEPENLSQLEQQSGVSQFTLGFIVATDANTCQAAWGGYAGYSVADQWGQADIQSFAQQGGNVAISFGGQAGTDLSAACSNATSLLSAYQSVLSTYKVSRLDFDIEGALLDNTTAITNMMVALSSLQKQNPTLQISFTLPVLPSGLTPEGINVLDEAINYGINVTYVNLMAMDYGSDFNPGTMGQYAINAAQATEAQLQNLYPTKSAQTLWAMIGITPMIGINDVWSYSTNPAQPERFILQDVSQIVSFAQQNGIQLLSSWAIDRDNSCTQEWASPTCSGELDINNDPVLMEQTDFQYAQDFEQASKSKQ